MLHNGHRGSALDLLHRLMHSKLHRKQKRESLPVGSLAVKLQRGWPRTRTGDHKLVSWLDAAVGLPYIWNMMYWERPARQGRGAPLQLLMLMLTRLQCHS